MIYEQNAVEMVGLVLDSSGKETLGTDDFLLAVQISITANDFIGAGNFHEQTRERQTAFLAALLTRG